MNIVNILIVEDETIIAEGLSSCLTNAGYKTTMVNSGEVAIDIMLSDPADLIIMDIHIDGNKDGIDTAIAIKKQASVPVIFLTDYDDPKTSARAALAKPSAYLLKPFNERQILLSIHQALYNIDHNLVAQSDDQDEPEEGFYIVNDCLFIRKDRNSAYRKVSVGQILYIEADRAYSNIYTTDTKYTQTNSMNKIHEKIKDPSFIQVHRSYVINLNLVEEIKGNLLIIGETEIPIGDNYKENVMKRFSLI